MKPITSKPKVSINGIIVALAAFCMTVQTVRAVGDTNEVWVSARPYTSSPGWAGTGAITNPFYGNINSIISSLTTNTTIHLLPGTFLNTNDITLLAGQRLLGAGIDTTTIRRAVTPTGGNMIYTTGTGVEVSDLTVDANVTSSNNWANNGVVLAGEKCAVRRVKVVNVSGNLSSGHEAIAINLGGLGYLGEVVSDCEVTNLQGTYTDGIGLTGQGVVQNNRVYGASLFGYGTSWTENGLFSHNLAESCPSGFYTDTGWETNLTIVGNTFRNCGGGVNITKGAGNGYTVVGLAIKDNTVEINTNWSGNVGIFLWNHETTFVPWQRISISGNTMHVFNDVSFAAWAVVVTGISTNFTSVSVANNVIDPVLQSESVMAHWEGNMYTTGTPVAFRKIGSGSPSSVTLSGTDGSVFVTSTNTTAVVLPKCAVYTLGNVTPWSGQEITVVNDKSSGNITVSPSSGDTLLPTSSVTISPNASAKFVCDGTSVWAEE